MPARNEVKEWRRDRVGRAGQKKNKKKGLMETMQCQLGSILLVLSRAHARSVRSSVLGLGGVGGSKVAGAGIRQADPDRPDPRKE